MIKQIETCTSARRARFLRSEMLVPLSYGFFLAFSSEIARDRHVELASELAAHLGCDNSRHLFFPAAHWPR